VNKVQLEPDQAIRLFQAASIGKLISGLIHNINGPLHTIGMEMDVMGVLLNKQAEPSSDILKGFAARLARMGEEFERLNFLIRQAAERADMLSGPAPAYVNLNHTVREELEFLKANLYFKHRVETVTEFDENMKSLTPRTSYLNLGIRWLLQAIVEDLEQNQIEKLYLKTEGGLDHALLVFRTEGQSLSPSIMDSMKCEAVSGTISSHDLADITILLAVSILKSSGISMDQDSASHYSQISLFLPYK